MTEREQLQADAQEAKRELEQALELQRAGDPGAPALCFSASKKLFGVAWRGLKLRLRGER